MYRKLLSTAFVLAAFACLASPSTADAAVKKVAKKAAKKKAEPLKTDEIFKKLDTNNDKKLDLEEFKKLFDVQPEPKGKKGKVSGPFDLPFIFKSLDADGSKTLSPEEFKGVIGAIFPAPKK